MIIDEPSSSVVAATGSAKIVDAEVDSTLQAAYAHVAREYSAIRTTRALAAILVEWLTIAIALSVPPLYIAGRFGSIYVQDALGSMTAMDIAVFGVLSLVSALVIACKQHALGVIMHDATHYRLVRDKRLNDLLSDLLCAFPIMLVTSSYRRDHLRHHRQTNTRDDPYWEHLLHTHGYAKPLSLGKFLSQLGGDLFGLNSRQWWRAAKTWNGVYGLFSSDRELIPVSVKCQFAVFWAVGFAAIVYLRIWPYFLLLWWVPLTTILIAFMRIRVLAEHDLASTGPGSTRHVDGSFLERFAIAPRNINFHLAHHLFPAVPFYALPALHRHMLADPRYVRQFTLWRRYLQGNDSLLGTLSKQK